MGEACPNGSCETSLGTIQRMAMEANQLLTVAEEAKSQGDGINANRMNTLARQAFQAIAETNQVVDIDA